MAISIRCPQCGRKLNAPDTAAGKRARCPDCKAIVTLPAASEAPPEDILDAEPLGVSDIPPPPALQTVERARQGFYPPDPEPRDIPLAPIAPGMEPAAPPRKPCPMCGEMIPLTAIQCRFCNEIFDPALKKARAKATSSASGDDDLSTGEWVVAILCSGIGCICGIIWMIQGKPKGKKMLGVSVLCAIIWSFIRSMIEGMARTR
jgi:phage FluMu protein Com